MVPRLCYHHGHKLLLFPAYGYAPTVGLLLATHYGSTQNQTMITIQNVSSAHARKDEI